MKKKKGKKIEKWNKRKTKEFLMITENDDYFVKLKHFICGHIMEYSFSTYNFREVIIEKVSFYFSIFYLLDRVINV